jgi:glutathione S-transferase
VLLARRVAQVVGFPNLSTGEYGYVFESAAIASILDSDERYQYGVNQNAEVKWQWPRLPAVEKQWCSAISDYVFRTLEHGIIKPRRAGGDAALIATNIEKARLFLKPLEALAADAHALGRSFLFPSDDRDDPSTTHARPSWVDLFLAPIVADLLATQDGPALISAEAGTPHLAQWFADFSKRKCFVDTYAGSLPDIIRKEKEEAAAAAAAAAAKK